MPQNISIKDFIERLSLAQQISDEDKNIKDYAGRDTALSLKLAKINVLEKHGLLSEIPKKDLTLMKDIIKEEIKAVMASSDKMDNFSILGFRVPKGYGGLNLADTEKQV